MSARRVLTFLFFLLFFLSFLFNFLCDGKNHDERVANGTKMTETSSKPPPHFVLVHGFGSGAWSWYKIRALMEASGYKVTCLDLKGAGIDRSDPTTIRTFDDYNEPLINFLGNLKDDENVILVGHSAGGVSVTDASHKFSHKTQVAVYVTATMLKHGFVTKKDLRDGAPAERGGNSTMAEEKSRCQTTPHIAPQEDAVLAGMLSRPGPLEAILQARFKGDGAEQVRRVYIKTMYDQVLKPQQQDAMIKRWPPSQVFNVKSDHLLLFSDPFVLFGLLDKVADSMH